MSTEEYTIRKARKQGKKEGRNWQWNRTFPFLPITEPHTPKPPIDHEEPADYEKELASVHQKDLDELASQWASEDRKLKTAYCQAKTSADTIKSKTTDEVQDVENLEEELKGARNKYIELSAKWLPEWIYFGILAIVVVGEGFFNYKVFQLFGQSGWDTWLMAIAIIAVIPMASELNGYHLKKENKPRLSMTFVALSNIVVVLLLAGIAVLRDNFFRVEEAQQQYSIPIDHTTLAAILIIFNCAIFIVLSFLAYTQSRKDPEGYRLARDRYRDVVRRYEKEMVEADEARKQLMQAMELLNEARETRQKTFEDYHSRGQKIQQSGVNYIHAYRQANMAARSSRTRPRSFDCNKPEEMIKLPPTLETIEWICSSSSPDQVATPADATVKTPEEVRTAG